MKVKETKKLNEKLFSEIEPGTLFRYGGLYFIKIEDYLFRKRQLIRNVKVSCCDSFPEFDYDILDESVEAICVENGKAWEFRQSELIEVFPDAFIGLE